MIGGGDVGGAKAHVHSLLKELSMEHEVILISLRPGVFAQEAKAFNIETVVIKTGNIITDVIKVIRIIKQNKTEVIHCHGAKANITGILAAFFTGIPLLTTIHSDYKLDYLHSLPRRLTIGLFNSFALRLIRYHACVSSNLKQLLLDRGFKKNNIFTIPNGMTFEPVIEKYDRKVFSEKYNVDLKDDDIVLGILARLTAVKGIDIFLYAAQLALKERPCLKFLIAGEGEERKNLEKLSESLGISKNTFFVGWIDNPIEFISNIDINVLSSISEGFPYSILEGARLGRPVISSRVGGIPDLVEDGVNGYLFESGNSIALARYMVQLSDNPDLCVEMGNRLNKKAASMFSLDSMKRSQLIIYKTIIHDSSPSGSSALPHDIIISGYYGFNNIGDDALLMSITNDIKRINPHARLLALSRNPAETSRNVFMDAISRLNLIGIRKAMKRAKLFIYGGGTLIQESTSTRSLLYYLSIIYLAKHYGLKVMLYANGIDPIKKKLNRSLTQKIVNMVDVITLREATSMYELERLEIKNPKVVVTADPALSVLKPWSQNPDLRDVHKNNTNSMLSSLHFMDKAETILNSYNFSKGPYIGFSARPWDTCTDYISIIAAAADEVIEKYKAVPVFIAMQYPDDIKTILRIRSKMKHKVPVIKRYCNVPETIDLVSKFDMLIGMRLHALLFAAGMKIPVVGIEYQPKVKSFLKYMGLNESMTGDLDNLTREKLSNTIDHVWNNRKNISKKLELRLGEYTKKASENAKIALELSGLPNIK